MGREKKRGREREMGSGAERVGTRGENENWVYTVYCAKD